jgi:hypothetical protein
VALPGRCRADPKDLTLSLSKGEVQARAAPKDLTLSLSKGEVRENHCRFVMAGRDPAIQHTAPHAQAVGHAGSPGQARG